VVSSCYAFYTSPEELIALVIHSLPRDISFEVNDELFGYLFF
jgi:hypothetical protein